MSTEPKERKRWEAWSTGVGSVVSLAGDADDLQALSGRSSKNDWEALSNDMEKIGSDFSTALYQAIFELSSEKKRLLADRIREMSLIQESSLSRNRPDNHDLP